MDKNGSVPLSQTSLYMGITHFAKNRFFENHKFDQKIPKWSIPLSKGTYVWRFGVIHMVIRRSDPLSFIGFPSSLDFKDSWKA
jgi:hypothetical protein